MSDRSPSASRRSAADAVRTSLAAAPASVEAVETPVMLLDTWLVPPAACWMLRAIWRVAVPCSSTAAATAVVTLLISAMVWPMLRIAETAVGTGQIMSSANCPFLAGTPKVQMSQDCPSVQ